MAKVKKTCKIGYSKKCPYEFAMATTTQGMDMAIMLGQLGSHKLELWLVFLREVLTKLIG
jgi:hypothetical protein